jgi:hypothetical protein
MDEEKLYTINEEANDVSLVFIGPEEDYSIEISYKGDMVYKENIAGVSHTIHDKIKKFSVKEKWNFLLEFRKSVTDFLQYIIDKKQYSELLILGITGYLSKVINILNADYEKSRITNIPNNKSEVTQSNSLNERPAYIKEMVDSGILEEDGKRVIRNLKNVTTFLAKKDIRFSEKELREKFLKPDGREYSLASCKKAINDSYPMLRSSSK